MDPLVNGLISVTGEPDSGKTTFAYSAGPAPQEIAFFDDDLKAETVHKKLGFGAYYNLHRLFAQQKKTRPIDFHDMVYELLDKLPTGIKLLVFDNFTRMEDGMGDWADAHMQEISGLTPGQASKMSQLTWPYKFNYYSKVLDLMLSKAPLVIITTHIKDQWLGGQKTGLKEARGQRPLIEKSSLRLWLRHNPDGPEPIGLVLKRISTQVWAEGKIKTVSILPRRIKPCTWDKVAWYLDNPIGTRRPTVDEMPSEFELSVLDGTLTADQKDVLKLARIAAETDGGHESMTISLPPPVVKAELDEGIKELIQRMLEQGSTPTEISTEVGVTLPQIMRVMKGG